MRRRISRKPRIRQWSRCAILISRLSEPNADSVLIKHAVAERCGVRRTSDRSRCMW